MGTKKKTQLLETVMFADSSLQLFLLGERGLQELPRVGAGPPTNTPADSSTPEVLFHSAVALNGRKAKAQRNEGIHPGCPMSNTDPPSHSSSLSLVNEGIRAA